MKLTLIRGLPGSGKSTLAGKYGVFHIEADMFCMKDGKYVFDINEHSENHKKCLSLAKYMLQQGSDVVVSNTFVTIAQLEPYLNVAIALGATINVIRMTRAYGNIHGVPIEVINKMSNEFEDYQWEVS